MRFEPFTRAHLPLIAELLADPETVRHTRIPEPPAPAFPAEWAAGYEAGRRDGTRDGFAVFDGDDAFVGLALAPSIDAEAAEAELGYMVAPPARGRGVATAMLRELTAWAFARGIRRCELFIDVRNPASERVAERAGYVREGTLRSIHHKGGERIDATLWSRLPTD
jgi:RimJ/RimL family protein N-acetyltransferase